MMVYASMATSALTTCGNGSNSSPSGTTCDIRQASLPGLGLSLARKTKNLAAIHDRRRSYSMLDLSDNEWCESHELQARRRPSFPSGVLDWSPRRKVLADDKLRQGLRASASKCLQHEEEYEGDNGHGVKRMHTHERHCPLYQPDRQASDLHRDNVSNDGESEVFYKNLTSPSCCRLSETSLSPGHSMLQCNCWYAESDKAQNNNNIDDEDDNYDDKQRHPDDGFYRNKRSKRKKNKTLRETVIINVGGHIFETYRATLTRLRTPIFHSDDKLELYYRKSHKDYFFDRDPTAFGSILNFLRTGELHIPTNMCGPALQNELDFWGIEEVDIARCCWTQYNTWKTQCRSLEKLENDRKFSTTQEQTNEVDPDSTCCERFKFAIWTFLQDPGSSKKAKAYAWLSIIFVFVSIFSFCAETHPMFKVKARDMVHFAPFYEFFNVQNVDWSLVNPKSRPNSSLPQTTESPASRSNTSISNSTTARAHARRKRTLPKHENALGCSSFELNKDVNENANHAGNKKLPHPVLVVMDIFCLVFFTLEYLTRFLCSPSKINFLRALQNIVDFLAFAPDYVELLFSIFDPNQTEGVAIMEMLFILRILRLFRIFRLIRHVPGLWILLYTLKASFNELMLMCVFLLIGMVVFATLVHFVEPDGTFNNIPVGFWWSVVTMTTVGYGDMYPRSAAGYVIGSCCAVAGLLMIAFTVPIIVSNFVLYYTHVQYGLARRDREIERLKEDGDIEPGRSFSRQEAERMGSWTSLVSRRKSQQLLLLATKNGKSYMPVSNQSDAENQETTSLNSPEKEEPNETTSIEMADKIIV